ncbi:MAG: neutral/alkaline non-lysosomal ceramidase N-terminal domain-containing protein [Bryobacterales bacterium]|nr:neutral/alkaline non-lysosomal ceramidase N-terminal domain-containing protein [Bryobacterales bacterium]
MRGRFSILPSTQLHAGTGRCDITPAPGTPQGGWGAQTHQRGLGADMPFYATALVLESGEERVAIVEADAIGFDREWTERILAAITDLTGFPRRRIRFSCSHTHSGPNTFRLATISEGLDMALGYLESLPQRIASAVWQARHNLKPVRAAAGQGACDINVNRRFRDAAHGVVVGRNWGGPANRTVGVVRFDDLDERPVATLLHYACHGTTMGWQTQLFTPDFPGPARQVVERELGGMCLFLQGACANLTPRRGFTGDCALYRKLGTILGLEAARAAWNLETLPRVERLAGVQPSGAPIALYEDVPVDPGPQQLSVVQRSIALPAKQFGPPEELEAQAAALRAEMNRLRREGTPEEIRAATARATEAGWRAEYARNYYGRETIPWELMSIVIGSSIALVSVPGEPFTETAMDIASRSPYRHTFVSGYSNGGFGYIPTAQAFAEGGYETEATPFSAMAADVLAGEAVRLLQEMAAIPAGQQH